MGTLNIAIIPARGGSKRIKNKNILDFFGRPMISYSLFAARDSGLFDRIHVSTDSEAIKDVVEGLGFPVEFLRPDHLADDRTGITPVMRWVLETYRSLGISFDSVGLILPCAPLLDADDLLGAYEIFREHEGRKPLMAVSAFPVAVEWAYRRQADGALVPVTPGAYAIRSQDLEAAFYDSGSLYFYSAEHILAPQPPTDMDYISYELPRTKAVDIDTEEDLQLAKALFLARHEKEGDGPGSIRLRSIAEERALRLRSRTDDGVEAEAEFQKALRRFRGTALEERATQAYEFAKDIEYTHPGLSARAYLAHPLRVASLAIMLDPDVQHETVVCALLHNVLEVSGVSVGEVTARFGDALADAISRLAVDRTHGTRSYMVGYYQRLAEAPRWVRIVKLLDKLDNLYMLYLNPNADARQSYLADIEEFILPIAHADLPATEGYIKALIADCREKGLLDTPVAHAGDE